MNIKTTCLSILCLGAAALPLGAEGTNQFASETARVSYALGMMTGHQWKQQDLGFEADVYAQGIKDALAGGQMRLTPEEATDPATASRFMRLHAAPGPLRLSYAAKRRIFECPPWSF